MITKIVYGVKNSDFDGQFIEMFFDEEDKHLGVNCTNEKTVTAYHFILKDGYVFDGLAALIENYMSCCANIADAQDMLEVFFDNEGLQYLEDYPEYIPEMRTEEEINEYMGEACDRVWLARKQDMFLNMLLGEECIYADILDRCNQEIEKVCEKYNINFQEPTSDWDYGYWSGILAALRWVMGDEKDMLDT